MELFRGQTKAESCEPQPVQVFVPEKGQTDQSNNANIGASRLRDGISYSVNNVVQTTANGHRLRQFDAVPVRFKNRLEFCDSVLDLRLCMAASSCTQHNKRATGTKRLLKKRFCASHK
jgi:hypothetical protein